MITPESEAKHPFHKALTNKTTHPKALSQRHIQIAITFAESSHSGECSDYNNTSQPAILCAKKQIFSNYI